MVAARWPLSSWASVMIQSFSPVHGLVGTEEATAIDEGILVGLLVVVAHVTPVPTHVG